MYWRKTDVINCLELLMLFHLYHFLCIVDDVNVIIAWCICYNLNLLDSGLTNSLKFSVISGISVNIINIQKNIYKTAIIRDYIDKKIEFDNHTNSVCHFDKPTTLQNKLIPIISKSHLLKSKSHHILKDLLLNTDFRKV